MRTHSEKQLLRFAARVFGEGRSQGLSILLLLIRRDLRLKYRNSFLGYAWSMMNPLLSMLIVTLVFSHVVRNVPQYPLHVLTGILVWNMCTLSLSGGANSLVGGGGLLRKVKIQSWIFPLVPVGLGLINLIFSLAPFFVIYFVYGNLPHLSWLLTPFVLLALFVFLMGCALLLAVSNVFFRDIGHMLEPILALTFYATPVIFDRQTTQFPIWVNRLLGLNPFTHFVELFRASLLSGPIGWQMPLRCIAIALSTFFVGVYFYKKNRNSIIFEL